MSILSEATGITIDPIKQIQDAALHYGVDFIADDLEKDGINPPTFLGGYDTAVKIGLAAIKAHDGLPADLQSDLIAAISAATNGIRSELAKQPWANQKL